MSLILSVLLLVTYAAFVNLYRKYLILNTVHHCGIKPEEFTPGHRAAMSGVIFLVAWFWCPVTAFKKRVLGIQTSDTCGFCEQARQTIEKWTALTGKIRQSKEDLDALEVEDDLDEI